MRLAFWVCEGRKKMNERSKRHVSFWGKKGIEKVQSKLLWMRVSASWLKCKRVNKLTDVV